MVGQVNSIAQDYQQTIANVLELQLSSCAPMNLIFNELAGLNHR